MFAPSGGIWVGLGVRGGGGERVRGSLAVKAIREEGRRCGLWPWCFYRPGGKSRVEGEGRGEEGVFPDTGFE